MADIIGKEKANCKRKRNRRLSVISFLFFIFSPFVALPFTLIEIYRRKKGAMLGLAMFMGILTYLLLPDWTLDIARYYARYEQLKLMDLNDFLFFLESNSDYVFYFLIFVFGKLNIKFQVLLFLMSTFNFYVFFRFFDKFFLSTIKSDVEYFSRFLFYLFSISILYYLSSTRYVLANSFFLLFIWSFFFNGERFRGVVFYCLAILTHTAFIIYLPFFLLISRIKNKKRMIIVSALIFVLFFLLPLDSVLLGVSSLLPGFVEKAVIYSELERASNWAPTLSHFIILSVSLWFLLRFYGRIPEKFLNLLLALLIPLLLSIPFGFIVYDRFLISFKPMLFLVVIYCQTQIIGIKTLDLGITKFCLLGGSVLYVTYSIYLYRYNIAPYFQVENMLLINILNKTYGLSDIFQL